MNLLLFDERELDGDNTLLVNGERGAHLRGVLGVNAGDLVRVGRLGGAMGAARVVALEGGSAVRLAIESLEIPAEPPLAVSLLIALPRPQSVKKILQLSATLGVSRVVFMSSDRVEPGYFSSPVLEAERIRQELLLGLEQARATILPEVEVLRGFAPGRKHVDAGDRARVESLCGLASRKILADLQGDRFPPPIEDRGESAQTLVAIGPEGGFRERELASFVELGFVAWSLGSRALRVETAVCSALSQLAMFDDLRASNKPSGELGKRDGER